MEGRKPVGHPVLGREKSLGFARHKVGRRRRVPTLKGNDRGELRTHRTGGRAKWESRFVESGRGRTPRHQR
jgi:hypothetical protein